MVETYKNILGIVPGIQSTAVVSKHVKMFGKSKIRSPPIKKQVKMNVGTMLDVSMIGATSKMIGDI